MLFEDSPPAAAASAASSQRPQPPPTAAPPQAPKLRVYIGSAVMGNGLVRPFTYFPVEIQRINAMPGAQHAMWLEKSRTLRRYSEMSQLYRYIQLRHPEVIVARLPQKTSMGNVLTTFVDETQLRQQRWNLLHFLQTVCSTPVLVADPLIQRYLQWPRDDSDARESRIVGAQAFPDAASELTKAVNDLEPPVASGSSAVGGAVGGGLVKWLWSAASRPAESASPPVALPPHATAARDDLLRFKDEYNDHLQRLQAVRSAVLQVLEQLKECEHASVDAVAAFKVAAPHLPPDANFDREMAGVEALASASPIEKGSCDKMEALLNALDTEALWWMGGIDNIDGLLTQCEVGRLNMSAAGRLKDTFKQFQSTRVIALDSILVQAFQNGSADGVRV